MKRIKTTTAVATALTALALTNGTANADGTDNYYIQEMQRMGWMTPDPQHDIATAKFVYSQMDQDPKNPIVTGVHTIFANVKGGATKNQMYGALRAAITSYCPRHISELHKQVDNDPWIAVP